MLFVDNKVDLFIMDGSFEFGDDFFREFSDNVRGNVREKVFNSTIRDVGGTLVEVREEFVYVFSSLFTLIGSVWNVIILNRGDNGRFSFLFVRGKVV